MSSCVDSHGCVNASSCCMHLSVALQDVGQLQLQVDGVTRSFAEWSAHYADTYYPRLGEQCYRVPAQHFNEQKLVSNESFRGVELGVPVGIVF